MRNLSLGNYDAWKTRSPDDERRDRCSFECSRCEDEGCIECCPEVPLVPEDIEQMDDEIAEFEGWRQ